MRPMAWIACLACWMVATAAFGGDLVRQGKAVGEFVLPSDATHVEVFAVTDTRHWIEEMTGAKVPIVSTPSEAKNTKVFVGTSYAGAFKEDLAKLAGNDGYAIREKDGNVYVFGSRPRGTMYGVFALLEKNSDIIWARPNEHFGTVYGKHENLELKETDVLDKPVFWYRSLGGGYPFHMATGEWQMRNGNNQIGRGLGEPEWDMMSIMGTNVAGPLADQFPAHPEYFGYNPITGTRSGVRNGEGTLCLTHPGLAALWAKAVAKQIHDREARDGRPVDLYIIGPGDNWFCCQCDQCTKPIALPGGGQLAMKDPDAAKDSLFRSTQVFMFLNEAMKSLKREVPETKIVMLAYIYTAEPPAVALDPDLLVFFAPYPTNSMHFPLLDPRQPEQWRTRFEAWMKKTPNLGFYEYFYSKPSPTAYYAAANLRALLKTCDPSKAVIYSEFDNDRGARGIGENALGWDVGAMNTWVIARLFWNPNQDADALYRYYIQRTYREAAPQMTAYYELIKASWLDPKDKTVDAAHAGISGIYTNMIVNKGLEGKVKTLLTEAETAAQNPNSKIMIRRMMTQFQGFSKGLNRLMVAHVPEMAHDGDTFASVQWEKPVALEEFNPVRRFGALADPSQRTVLKAAEDGKNLYLRFTAEDAGTKAGDGAASAKKGQESWPLGDHGEIWFNRGATRYVFAFDRQGHAYDARDYDRSWNSNWRVVTRQGDGGWEAIAVIPLEALGLKPGQASNLQWMALRQFGSGDKPQVVSYKGTPLYKHFFPVVME